VPFRAGRHKVGRDDGTLQVRTYREGFAQKVGHDLIIDVGQWEATAEIREDGTVSAVRLDADPGGRPIVFRSTAVEPGNGAQTVPGELELAGTRRPASFELTEATDGHLRGTLPVTQSDWGIKPYRGMMGALKVRDTIEVILDVPLPSN
jgi:polyisoprenoid-binding protein YceI